MKDINEMSIREIFEEIKELDEIEMLIGFFKVIIKQEKNPIQDMQLILVIQIMRFITKH